MGVFCWQPAYLERSHKLAYSEFFESVGREQSNHLAIKSGMFDGSYDLNGEAFVQSVLKFNKNSLLHIYVSSTLYCYYRRYFHKNADCVEDEDVNWWVALMKGYGVRLTRRGYKYDVEDAAWSWFKKNEIVFTKFFDIISEEVVHILFNDKHFLVKFNRIVRNVLIDENGTYSNFVKWPEGYRNEDGTIKRCAIPKWVKQAVFHRDKGHCVFCNKNLTGLVNIFDSQKNYDHIIPLKDYGANDPCNIQLSREECNKSKGRKDIVPIYKYQSWW